MSEKKSLADEGGDCNHCQDIRAKLVRQKAALREREACAKRQLRRIRKRQLRRIRALEADRGHALANLDLEIEQREALEAEAATLRAERDKLRGVVKDWLALHDESERDEVVLLRVSREVGQLSDDGEHLLALRTDLLAFRDRFRQALDHTTPAPSGAKESDDE